MIRSLFSCVGWVASVAIPMAVFRPRVIDDIFDNGVCNCFGPAYGGNHWFDCPQHLVETCTVCSPSNGPDAGNPQPGTGQPVVVDACRSTTTGPDSDKYCQCERCQRGEPFGSPTGLVTVPENSSIIGCGNSDQPTSQLLDAAAELLAACNDQELWDNHVDDPLLSPSAFIAELRARAAELRSDKK